MDIYYCGFNGFRQVPIATNSDTLTCLTLHTKSAKVIFAVLSKITIMLFLKNLTYLLLFIFCYKNLILS